MCVTNTVTRRPRAITLPSDASDALPQQSGAKKSAGKAASNPVRAEATTSAPVNPTSLWSAIASLPAFEQHPATQKPQRPKRKRKPQQPGFTAKHHVRHFVSHDYHDHSHDEDLDASTTTANDKSRCKGFAATFPLKLHAMLDQISFDGYAHVISWQVHGRAFKIHKPKDFVNHVMPTYFRQTKLTSFQRQLNLYGFQRLTKGDDHRAYYHELFLRGKEFLAKKMIRTKVKGTGFKAASSPDAEPDFFAMAAVASPVATSDEEDGVTGVQQVAIMSPVVDSSFEPCVAAFEHAAPKNVDFPEHNPVGDRTADILNEVVDELFVDSSIGDDDAVLDFVESWGERNPALRRSLDFDQVVE